MQFILAETPRYWWPVIARVPDPENAGKIIEQTFRVQFEPQGRDEAVAQQEAYDKMTGMRERVEHEHAQLRAIVKDWDLVVDEKKKPVPFTIERFNAALQQPWFRTAINRAYVESMAGEEARLGN